MRAQDQAIGIFDSGVGGLSVLKELRRELPNEPLMYVADSGFAPYGDREPEFIVQRSEAVVRFLLAEGVKAIVVACNTATGVAVEILRRRYPLPIVAIEPAIKPAVAATRSGIVGVLATSATLASRRFASLIDRHGAPVRIVSQPCPGLVEQVELGDLDGPYTARLVESYVQRLVQDGADTLVLGCTHYSFLLPLIRATAGNEVMLIDPAAAVAREVRRQLEHARLQRVSQGPGAEAFWSSGSLDHATRLFGQLWSTGALVQSLPSEFCNPPL